ncbi:MAG: phosphatidylinositol-specific phospholipase C/glycerophosphodiester phosphodiesterase family protein [Bacteroidetes bacterium]|nr:phosphatidylinositol-specific phospholipase C/glycerophosphodiester phosphodiesterase family protein [Bacteroidota bacterium]
MNLKPTGHFLLAVILFVAVGTFNCKAQPNPLPNGFAHNDYKHKHPLFDALDDGFTNIEADVFLKDNKLVVGHFCPIFHYGRSLDKLYLKPLYDRVEQNNGYVYANYKHPVILMIDIKTEAEPTYRFLEQLLQKYPGMFTHYENGEIVEGAVTVVISGHKPYKLLENEQNRFAFIDDDLRRVARDTATHNVFTMASCKYSHLLRWTGKGPMPFYEHQRLCTYVAIAHSMGSKVRLWASPENTVVWNELLRCGVDLINTDHLSDLKNYLASNPVIAPQIN